MTRRVVGCARPGGRFSRRGPSMSVARETLPLSIGELQRTREPLERATRCRRRRSPIRACSTGSSSTSSRGGWICAGHVDQVRERGDFVMVELGGESVFVVADDDGAPARVPEHLPPPRRAHRRASPRAACGACSAPTTRGPTASTARCAARRSPTGSRTSTRAATGCTPVRARGRRGPRAARPVRRRRPPPARARRRPARRTLARYRLGELRRGARIVYDVDANWKAIAENYSECLHCPGVHPELNRLSHYLSRRDDRAAPARGAAAR